jgi:hypothetical protein
VALTDDSANPVHLPRAWRGGLARGERTAHRPDNFGIIPLRKLDNDSVFEPLGGRRGHVTLSATCKQGPELGAEINANTQPAFAVSDTGSKERHN